MIAVANPHYKSIEDSEMFLSFRDLANYCWTETLAWDWYAKATVGKQLVCAADSIGANISEGCGRFGNADTLRFLMIARGSARETRYWLSLCSDRNLLSAEAVRAKVAQLDSAVSALNGLIRYRRERGYNAGREGSNLHSYKSPSVEVGSAAGSEGEFEGHFWEPAGSEDIELTTAQD